MVPGHVLLGGARRLPRRPVRRAHRGHRHRHRRTAGGGSTTRTGRCRSSGDSPPLPHGCSVQEHLAQHGEDAQRGCLPTDSSTSRQTPDVCPVGAEVADHGEERHREPQRPVGRAAGGHPQQVEQEETATAGTAPTRMNASLAAAWGCGGRGAGGHPRTASPGSRLCAVPAGGGARHRGWRCAAAGLRRRPRARRGQGRGVDRRPVPDGAGSRLARRRSCGGGVGARDSRCRVDPLVMLVAGPRTSPRVIRTRWSWSDPRLRASGVREGRHRVRPVRAPHP